MAARFEKTLSSKKSETSPYKKGAGRYPKRLYARVAIELAVVLRYFSTEFNIMPVKGAIMVDPKKNTSHKNRYVGYLLFK